MDSHATNPLDEQDQDEIISDIQLNFQKDMKRISSRLSTVCYGAALASAVSMTLSHSDNTERSNILLSSFYPLYTCIIHCNAAYISKNLHESKKEDMPKYSYIEIMINASVIGSIGALLPVAFFYTTSITDTALWSLAISSLLTMATAIIFKADFYWSNVAIQDLQKCKYKYKSL